MKRRARPTPAEAASPVHTPRYPLFLTLVVVLHNAAEHLPTWLSTVGAQVAKLVDEYQLIIIDHASTDATLQVLRQLVASPAHPNVQVFALSQLTDPDTATWVGVENALGDAVLVLDPAHDDVAQLPTMLAALAEGADVVVAHNQTPAPQPWLYRVAAAVFNAFYKLVNGLDLPREAPRFRLLNRRVVNYVAQHARPPVVYRYVPVAAGFKTHRHAYASQPVAAQGPRTPLGSAVRLLVASTAAPLRLATLLCLLGALLNVVYSFYVIAVALFKTDVAPGWITLSLQQSGMFFLLSIVLMVLAEYVLQGLASSQHGPAYYVREEFQSAHLTRTRALNVHVLAGQGQGGWARPADAAGPR